MGRTVWWLRLGALGVYGLSEPAESIHTCTLCKF